MRARRALRVAPCACGLRARFLVSCYEDSPPVYCKVARPRRGARVRVRGGTRREGVVEGFDLPGKRPMVLWDGTHYAVPVDLSEIEWD